MAAKSCRKRLREEATCAVCLDFLTAPVTLDCGHNFCRACIAKSWEESPADAACPQCRERVQPCNLRPNWQLANMVKLVKELNGLPRRESAGDAACERHQEPLKLFCRDDEALICVVCDRAKEHRAHRVVPVDEAAQEYQDQISHSLESLRKEKDTILLYKAENENESQDLLETVQIEREKTAAAFSQLRQFLEEQEKLLQAQMEEVEKEIARRRDEHQASLSAELSSFDSLIQELEEKQQQTGNELLQNIKNILERLALRTGIGLVLAGRPVRCKEESFENPVAFPAALKWKIHDFCDINPFLEGVMKQFQDSLASGLQLQEANVILDPDTAHPRLVLSEDGKSVRRGDERQALPKNPKRFVTYAFVLGREGFTSGRHFWEVAVGSEGEWSVGVARKSMRRKGSPEGGIWDVGMWGGEYRVSLLPDDLLLFLSQQPKKIRVTLNYAGGRVAFFDADTGAKLYIFSDASFCGETLLPFFYVTEKAHLKLLS